LGHDGRPRRRDPLGARGRRPPACRDHGLCRQIRLGLLRPLPRGGRQPGPAQGRQARLPDEPRQHRGGAARGGARHCRGRRLRDGQAGPPLPGRCRPREGCVRSAHLRLPSVRGVCDDRGRGRGRRERPRRADPRDPGRLQARRRQRRPHLSCGGRRAPDRRMIEQLRSEIQALRGQTRPLEPDASERRALGEQALDHALAYLDQVEAAPSNRSWSEVFAQRLEPEFTEAGREASAVLGYVAECIDRPGFATTSPRFMAYIPGGGLFHSAMGDLIAATSNKYSGFASASPGAVRIENACTAWLAEVIGYPKDAGGTLTSGGSVANLTAIVAAREARDPQGGGAVYVTRFADYCIDKALHIAGRGRSPKRIIPTDANYRMSVEALEQALEQDRRDGSRPWLVI